MTNTSNTLTIYNYAPASNMVLAGALVGLREQIEAAAQANLDQVLQTGEEYTETEQLAMLRIEQLRQVNGLDLAAVLLRADYLREIERNNLIARHPAGYQSLQAMARDQGISLSELSQTLDLANVIFPYVQDTLGMPIPVLWESIGKSNMRELVPVLKGIITGDGSATGSARLSMQRLLDDVAATARAAGEDIDFDTEEGQAVLRRRAVEGLLEDGALLTNRELRQRIRPERTEPIEVTSIVRNGEQIIVASMDGDQWQNFMRRAGTICDFTVVDIANLTPGERQREALRIGTLRTLLDMVSNG